MPGPIQSGISGILTTAAGAAVAGKHLKEQEEQQQLVEKIHQEDIERDRVEEQTALKKEAKDLGPNDWESKVNGNQALRRAGMNLSYEDFQALKEQVSKLSPETPLKEQIPDRKLREVILNAKKSGVFYDDMSGEKYLRKQDEIKAEAEQRYYNKANNRVKKFTQTDAYKLRMMYAKGEIGSRQELTRKLAELAADRTYKDNYFERNEYLYDDEGGKN